MDFRVQLYDSYTGITPPYSAAMVQLIRQYGDAENGEEISEALDYALKNKPSFGGYIFSCWDNYKLIACVVVNQTGMSKYNPGYLLAYAVTHPDCKEGDVILQDLVQKAVQHAKGEIALHLKPNHPGIALFKRIGFEEEYVELRMNAQIQNHAAAS